MSTEKNIDKKGKKVSITSEEFQGFMSIWNKTVENFKIPLGDSFCNYFGIEDPVLRIDRDTSLQVKHIEIRYIRDRKTTPEEYGDVLISIVDEDFYDDDINKDFVYNKAIRIAEQMIAMEAKAPNGDRLFFQKTISYLKSKKNLSGYLKTS